MVIGVSDPYPQSKDAHLITVMHHVCFVRLFDITAFVYLDEQDGHFSLPPERSHCFVLDYTRQTHAQMLVPEYLTFPG